MEVNRRVRAILRDDDGHIVLIKRTKLDQPAYWVAPGGGIEPSDDSEHEALARELMEECGALAIIGSPLLRLEMDHRIEVFYHCTLTYIDPVLRYGPELEDPSRGEYSIEAIPFTKDSLQPMTILPEAFKALLLKLAP